MAQNTYSVGYSTNARAKCKYSGCGEPIAKDDIRFSKGSASAFSERPKFDYYHSKCMFMSFVRAKKTTKKIESMNDIEGVDSLKAADKDNIKKLLKEWKSGSMKDQVPKITRKRKADGDDDGADDKKKKKKKKTTKETSQSNKKTTRKTNDSDEEEEEEEYKPKKSRKVTKSDEDEEEEEEPKQKSHLVSKKTETKKPKEDSEDDEPEEEDEEDENFKRILKGKSASSNQKKEIDLDSDKSEDEKKAPPPKQPSPKTTSKKRKSESDEEVKESESSAEDEEEEEEKNSDKFLSGKIIATIGKLSMPREKIIGLIEKNGGKYAKSITKDVTHVICAKKDDKTQKLQKAKELGKIIVTESFLKRGQ
jgi:hypothetical protein